MFTLSTLAYVLMTVLMFSGLFLIGLVLLQRGRGGGLAGAFGGMGGQSAFGTKAGDVFTRITIGVASFWILLCAINVVVLRYAVTNVRAAAAIKENEESPADKKEQPKDDEPAATQNELPKPDAPDKPQAKPEQPAEEKQEQPEAPAAPEKPAAPQGEPKEDKPADKPE